MARERKGTGRPVSRPARASVMKVAVLLAAELESGEKRGWRPEVDFFTLRSPPRLSRAVSRTFATIL
jgi:hypothetical protein